MNSLVVLAVCSGSLSCYVTKDASLFKLVLHHQWGLLHTSQRKSCSYFRVCLRSFRNVSVINCWCFSSSTSSTSVAAYTSGLWLSSGHSKRLHWRWPMFVQWLWLLAQLGSKKHLSVTCSVNFANLKNGWVQTKGKRCCLKFPTRSRCKYLEMEADILVSCIAFVFWCQSQMFSVYSKNKGTGLAVAGENNHRMFMLTWVSKPRQITSADLLKEPKSHFLYRCLNMSKGVLHENAI